MGTENRTSNTPPADWLADPNRPQSQASDQPTQSFLAPAQQDSLGSPRQEANDALPINEAESLLKKARTEYEKESVPPMRELRPDQGWSLAGLLKKSGLTSLVLALSSLSLLFLATQALAFISYLSAFPLWGQYLGYAVGSILVLAVLIFMGRFVLTYYRLEKSPRISMNALRELNQRAELRQQAAGLLQESKNRLVGFLESYPLESDSQKEKLGRLGVIPEDIDLLERNRKQLLESAPEEGCENWLTQMDARFIALLDKAAKKRITRYAWLVGIKTAAAPIGFVDASIVLINAYRLMEDLCRIYRLRAGGMGTVSILTRIFVNAFAAARLEEWMDSATDHLIDTAAQGTDGMAAFFKVISGGVLSRAAEGGANAFLLVRLGAAGIHYLRPLAERPVK